MIKVNNIIPLGRFVVLNILKFTTKNKKHIRTRLRKKFRNES